MALAAVWCNSWRPRALRPDQGGPRGGGNREDSPKWDRHQKEINFAEHWRSQAYVRLGKANLLLSQARQSQAEDKRTFYMRANEEFKRAHDLAIFMDDREVEAHCYKGLGAIKVEASSTEVDDTNNSLYHYEAGINYYYVAERLYRMRG